jgi:hypothetical protein
VVRVLLDPGDEVRVSVGLLERHDPVGGLVVVHPTPGHSGLAALAHDVLAALGRSIRRLEAERLVGSAQAGRAVAAWLLADQIEDLVVLRADRLSAPGWDWLLTVCRRTGTRLLLICHRPAVPPALADVLEGTTHEILTDLSRALPGRQCRPGRGPATIHSMPAAAAPETVDLPLYANEQIDTYRSAAPAAIGLRGFLQTDAVYQRGRAAAAAWLDTHCTGAGTVLDTAQVQLFLTELVQDSPTRNHSLARLRGAQAGFRARSFDLTLPPWQLMVTGQLTGPGLDHGADGLSVPVLERIRAGVAHPTIGAGIALSLLTQLPILFLHSLPWEALSPDNDALQLTSFPRHATLVPSTFTIRKQHPITAVFAVPPAVRPLLQALRHFAADSDNTTGRLFASTIFTLEHIGAAAAHCTITLPDQHSHRAATLLQTWQSHITCTYNPYQGSTYDTRFLADQAFAANPHGQAASA